MTRDKHGRLTRTTFKYGGAEVTLVYEDDNTARLVGLYSKNRGRGEAKEVMLEATAHADRLGVTIWLEVQRYGDWGIRLITINLSISMVDLGLISWTTTIDLGG